MKKFLPLFLLACLCQAHLFGQQNAGEMSNNTKDQLNASTMKLDASDVLYGFDSKKSEVLGDYYLDLAWRKGTVIFYPAAEKQKSDTLRGFPMRLDLESSELEFQTQFGIKAVSPREIQSFEFWEDGGKTALRFVNAREFGEKG
ncbi:MAG: hypothetical protein AAB316_00935 [Bacteroidota bacterium]